jgi:hypothetical protein
VGYAGHCALNEIDSDAAIAIATASRNTVFIQPPA